MFAFAKRPRGVFVTHRLSISTETDKANGTILVVLVGSDV